MSKICIAIYSSIQLFISLFSTAKALNLKQTCCLASVCTSLVGTIAFPSRSDLWSERLSIVASNPKIDVDCCNPFVTDSNCQRTFSRIKVKGWWNFGAFWLFPHPSWSRNWFLDVHNLPSLNLSVCRVELVLLNQNCCVYLSFTSPIDPQSSSPATRIESNQQYPHFLWIISTGTIPIEDAFYSSIRFQRKPQHTPHLFVARTIQSKS